MNALPRYIPGSIDRRDFRSVEGCSFRVERYDNRLEIGFYGGGRDGDYVPSTMREPDVLAKLVEGVPSLQKNQLGYTTDSEQALERLERMMLERSGGYSGIYRQVWNNYDAAVGVLALPREPGMKRNVYLSGPGPSVSIDLSLTGDGVVAGTDERVPTAKVPAFLAAALARLGPHDVRVVDSP
ncbi:MAG: hypothetical protein H0T46_14290 [Deltaproteobacteria bacterium]|nr:hypothetical protein [Deltaproteobacteria bacterium]